MSMAKDNKEALMGTRHELGTADKTFFFEARTASASLCQPLLALVFNRPPITVDGTALAHSGRNGRLLLINLLPRDERDHPSVH